MAAFRGSRTWDQDASAVDSSSQHQLPVSRPYRCREWPYARSVQSGDGATATSPWDRVEVSDWAVLSVEKSGSSVATWLEEPDTQARWLHKDTVIPSSGVEQGEDWSEVASTQIAILLGLPCARTRLCLRGGRRGSLSLDVAPRGHSLYEGIVALERCPEVVDYYPHVEGSPGVDPLRLDVKRPGHSLRNVRAALDGLLVPPDSAVPASMSAFDVMAGYLIFDALVANRDRHEQNWAILVPALTTSAERLAPTYDHASSLGYNLHDRVRRRLVSEGGLEVWAGKGTAWRFEHTGTPLSLVDLAAQALEMCEPSAADYWRQRVHDLDLQGLYDEFDGGVVSGMSVDASRFATALLIHNLERLRHAI